MYFDDLTLHQKVTLSPVTVQKEEMLDFAYRYDNAPIHTDEAYAKTTMFGRLLAPGVMSFMLVWSKYLELDFFGEQLLAGASTKIEWHKPVFADDTLFGSAEITTLTPRSPRNGMAVLTILIHNQNGEHVITGTVEAVVKRKERNQT